MQLLIEEFLLDGRAAGWSRGTERAYRWHLDRFATSISANITELTRQQVKRWAAGLGDTWAPATRKGATTAVRSFLAWCHREGHTATNLAAAVKTPKIPKVAQRTITVAEITRMIDACAEPVERGLCKADAMAAALRNGALVALLFDSMIRVSEACRLSIADVDTKSKKLLVRSGKGGNDRLAMFTSETARLIEAWLEVRRSDDNALFVAIGGNTPGAPLTPRGLRIIVKKVGERAGLTGVSPHAFRRGGAVGLTLNGAPGRVVMQAAGWSSQRMLETYTRNISDADIEAAYRRYAPLERPETAPQPTKSEP